MNIMSRLEFSKKARCLSILAFICVFSSCITNRELEYFNNQMNNESINYKKYDYQLQVNDLLSIQISSVTEDKFDFFNNKKSTNNMMATNPYLYGYLIEKDGTLELPMLGEIDALGKTLGQLEDEIQNISVSYFKSPVVKANILNFEIDILGEVNSPKRYRIIDPKINILSAIAMAGDITEIGNRKKIKVIRLNDKNPRIFYLDLRDKDAASNINFFLQPNDIVYVAPSNKRFYAFKNLPSVISLGISAFTLYLLINKE
jgi:polysaccharide export outer membrane protein|tara:strand:- start:1850 stop:2626 length:777 start_codon:yes stop_codon:yes gene_type:complete